MHYLHINASSLLVLLLLFNSEWRHTQIQDALFKTGLHAARCVLALNPQLSRSVPVSKGSKWEPRWALGPVNRGKVRLSPQAWAGAPSPRTAAGPCAPSQPPRRVHEEAEARTGALTRPPLWRRCGGRGRGGWAAEGGKRRPALAPPRGVRPPCCRTSARGESGRGPGWVSAVRWGKAAARSCGRDSRGGGRTVSLLVLLNS